MAVLGSTTELENFHALVPESVAGDLDKENKGPYTVFAPSNSAFTQSGIKYNKMKEDALENLPGRAASLPFARARVGTVARAFSGSSTTSTRGS